MENNNKVTGNLFIAGAIALFIPYTILTIIFEYPDVLRQDTGVILTKFHEGGSKLIWTWFAFALSGIPLIPAYLLLGQQLDTKSRIARIATTVGIIGLIVQMVGLLRWTFVVPVIADSYVNEQGGAARAAAVMSFKVVHQFGGVLLGEHMGQLFTIAWTALITFLLSKFNLVPKWIVWLGYIASAIYLLAQAELLGTVMPGLPNWGLAGFLGSTLWLIWLIILGFRLRKLKIQ